MTVLRMNVASDSAPNFFYEVLWSQLSKAAAALYT